MGVTARAICPETLLLKVLMACVLFGGHGCNHGGQQDDTASVPTYSSQRTSPPPAPDSVSALEDADETNVLYPGQSLWAGGWGLILDSDGMKYGARLTDEGRFILYNSSGTLWTAPTQNKAPGYELIMQDDGHLVLYDRNNVPVWASRTHSYYGGEKFRMDDWKPVKLVLEPGRLVLVSATGRRVWRNDSGEIKDEQ